MGEERGSIFSTNEERLKHVREVWKVAMDTQMHFNDLLMKMRTTVISIILAVFGASALVVKDIPKPLVDIWGWKLHISSIVLFVGILFLVCQYYIDRFYYFKLLLGEVEFTRKIDKDYEGYNGGEEVFGLTKAINKEIDSDSAKKVLFWFYIGPIIISFIVVVIIQLNLSAVVGCVK